MPHSPQTNDERMRPSDAAELARQLLTNEAGGDASAAATIAAAQRTFVLVTRGLSRWFGPFGAQVLVTRALGTARAQHSVLADVSMTETAGLTGLDEVILVHGVDAISDGIVGVISALAELLGRLIGDDLATSLINQSLNPQLTNGRAVPGATPDDETPDAPSEGGSRTAQTP